MISSEHPKGIQFADLEMNGYVNINSIFPQADRLHGTETLCGDWQGSTLIVGQDFAHASRIRERLATAPNQNPFCHGQIETNKNLCEFLHPKHFVTMDGSNAKQCGVLYGNAIWLLKDGYNMSAGLPRLKRAFEINAPILRKTIEAMPNLDTILCLGKVSYNAVLSIYRLTGDWRSDRDQRRWQVVGGTRIYAMAHPGSLGINNRASGISREECRKLVAQDFALAFTR